MPRAGHSRITWATVIINNSDTNGDAVSQIYETFLYNNITDVSVMQPATLYHYVVMESDGLEQLRAVFEGMDSETTVVMIRTRTPYNGGGIICGLVVCGGGWFWVVVLKV